MTFPGESEEHRLFRQMARSFVERELAPHAERWEEAGAFPDDVFAQVGAMGFLGLNVPTEYGGQGSGDYFLTVIWLEELARSNMAGLNMALAVQSDMATPVLAEIGSDEIKRTFLAPAVRGEAIAALGITEPSCGSDVAALRTTARTDGDDYVIDGSKTFITNGTRADFVTLAVRTGADGYGGISLVVLPTDVRGFSVGRVLRKVGNHTSDTAELHFDGCRIPRRYLIGEENQGFRHIMMNFQRERLAAAILATAGMQHLWEMTVDYARQREAFGRPLVGFQIWRHKLVEHLTSIEASRRLMYHAASRFGAGHVDVEAISMAKLFACDLAQRVVYDLQQLHGGYGYMEEYPIARAFRDLRLLTIGGGTSEVMKEIVGKLRGF